MGPKKISLPSMSTLEIPKALGCPASAPVEALAL
jgi:hypothetical protein